MGLVISSSSLIAEGSPKELVRMHVGESVVEAKNETKVQECLRGSVAVKESTVIGENILISTSDPQDVIDRLLRSCNISSASVRKATLEDVFLKLTGRSLRE